METEFNVELEHEPEKLTGKSQFNPSIECPSINCNPGQSKELEQLSSIEVSNVRYDHGRTNRSLNFGGGGSPLNVLS